MVILFRYYQRIPDQNGTDAIKNTMAEGRQAGRKSDFLGPPWSHEIRTPMNAIIGMDTSDTAYPTQRYPTGVPGESSQFPQKIS